MSKTPNQVLAHTRVPEPPWVHKTGRNVFGPLLARGAWAVPKEEQDCATRERVEKGRTGEEQDDDVHPFVLLLCAALLSTAVFSSIYRLYEHFFIQASGLDYRGGLDSEHQDL